MGKVADRKFKGRVAATRMPRMWLGVEMNMIGKIP